MHTYSRTKRKRDFLIALLTAAGIAALAIALILVIQVKPDRIDRNQIVGRPDALPDENGYMSYSAAGVASVSLCCRPSFDGRIADFYLTNPQENQVLLKAEIYSVRVMEDRTTGEVTYLPDQLIGKTGYIEPGNYVRSIRLKNTSKDDTSKIMIKICTMMKESGQSNGFFYIRTTIS